MSMQKILLCTYKYIHIHVHTEPANIYNGVPIIEIKVLNMVVMVVGAFFVPYYLLLLLLH